jgi:hypothetical protein
MCWLSSPQFGHVRPARRKAILILSLELYQLVSGSGQRLRVASIADSQVGAAVSENQAHYISIILLCFLLGYSAAAYYISDDRVTLSSSGLAAYVADHHFKSEEYQIHVCL